MLDVISLLLIGAISSEIPKINEDIKYDHFKSGLNELILTDKKIIQEENDYLINPEVDLAIMDTIQLFETRLRPNTKDGDCHWQFKKNAKSILICNSVGNMQISVNAINWVKDINSEKFKNITVADLRKPEVNTRLGYFILHRFKLECGNSLPGVWITAYGQGKCPKNNRIDFEGIRRCAIITEQLKIMHALPENWKCGHENKKLTDKTTLKFIKGMEKYNNENLVIEKSE